jgi:hypothetical protein
VSESFLVGVCPSFVSGAAAITEDEVPRVRCLWEQGCTNDRFFIFHEDLLSEEREEEREILYVQFMLFVFHGPVPSIQSCTTQLIVVTTTSLRSQSSYAKWSAKMLSKLFARKSLRNISHISEILNRYLI